MLLAVRVKVLVLAVVEAGLKLAVTPLGRPLAEKVTELVKLLRVRLAATVPEPP